MDWRNIRVYNNSQNNAFEELVCQLARNEKNSAYVKFTKLGAPDGGLEAFWKLKDNSEQGWQAKYVFSIEDAIAQANGSFSTALKTHPELKPFILAVPFDLPDPMYERDGKGIKSSKKKWEDKVVSWKNDAQKLNREIEIYLWDASTLLNKLMKPENEGMRYTTAAGGKNYNTTHYNLDVIISLGYRVKSKIATNFRRWATERLKEYMIKGFTMDDERLKNLGGGNYWKRMDRMVMVTALDIVNSATEMGFDKCGIIPVEMMLGYEGKLEERMQHFPETKKKYEGFRAFAHLKDNYPWAKSVVICSFWYGKYHIPDELHGHIAKYYLTDGRRDTLSEAYQTSIAFEKYLTNCGIQVATDRDFGITSLRWAAMQAGIGIIRKNNFFYTERGSYQSLEAFLIDQSLEYIAEKNIRPCAEKCNLCMKACPTGSLEAPYMMCRNTCISCLTTWDGWDLRKEPLRDKIGKWIYGCEACQDTCPYNKEAWTDEEEFPGLEELSRHLTYSEIVCSDYTWLETVL